MLSIIRPIVLIALLFGPGRVWAEAPLEVVTWAPTTGPEALWQEALGGLKTAAGLINANGGLNGRPVSIEAGNLYEGNPDFIKDLGRLLSRPGLAGAVGGPVHLKAEEASDLFRRVKRPWLGPWSNEAALYKNSDSDPLAILPPWSLEMPALLSHIKESYLAEPARSGPIFLIYYNYPAYQAMAAETKSTARQMGLELKRAPLNPDFTDWEYLADHIKGSGAVIIWLSPGASAAMVRAAKSRMPEALYLTSSINATNSDLVILSGGAWNGMLFPAVLKPSRDIPEAFDGLIRRYGPVGLNSGYQAYLGFAQGQIMARALALGREPGGGDLAANLYNMKGFPTILSAPIDFSPGRHINKESFYIGRAYGDGHWEAASPPRPDR